MQADSDLFLEEDSKRGQDFLTLKAKELNVEIDKIAIKNDITQVNLLLSLSTHKSVSVRRKVIKVLGNLGTKHIIPSLEKWKENESDNESYLLLTSLISRLEGIEKRSSGEGSLKPWKVAEVIKLIKNLVGSQTYLIEGEISQPQNYGQMLYFGLKDDQETRIDCRILSFKLNNIDFPLNEGLQVLIKGRFNLNKNTKLVFEVQTVELTGEGALLRNLKKLEAKLKSEGLFDETRKRKIPTLPRKILLVASPNSAAINDFTKVLNHRRGGIEIFQLPIKTQGKYAEAEILEKLSKANDICDVNKIDSIVITRGGGSKDDLHVFNSEKVVRAIHSLNRPTIVAIGHERDFTLSEYVCDKRASTPSNAAELVSKSSSEVINTLNHQYQSIINISRNRVENGRQYMNRYIDFSVLLLNKEVSKYREVTNKADVLAGTIIGDTRNEVNQKLNKISYILQSNIDQKTFELSKMSDSVLTLINHNYQELKHQSELLISKTLSMDPKKVLKMGYALIKQGNIDIDSAAEFEKDKPHTVVFHDGEINL